MKNPERQKPDADDLARDIIRREAIRRSVAAGVQAARRNILVLFTAAFLWSAGAILSDARQAAASAPAVSFAVFGIVALIDWTFLLRAIWSRFPSAALLSGFESNYPQLHHSPTLIVEPETPSAVRC
mgnify:FL=1